MANIFHYVNFSVPLTFGDFKNFTYFCATKPGAIRTILWDALLPGQNVNFLSYEEIIFGYFGVPVSACMGGG